MSLNQSQLNKSRLDKFLMVIGLPDSLKNINTTDLGARTDNKVNENSLQFSVYGAVIPSVTVPEITEQYAGQSFKVSSHVRPAYDNITVNFTIDNNFNNYWILYKWLDLLNNDRDSVFDFDNISKTQSPSTRNKNKSLTPPDLYMADMTLYAKDEFDKNKVKFTYKNAFPVSLGAINYNYRTEGEVETTFEFAFSQLMVELL
tara:strand:+ start:2045 stop:2650 length:606 start_codon:yes stop_codon:yes gene_type:complete